MTEAPSRESGRTDQETPIRVVGGDIVAVFQGGGAKGVAHVGALSAIEARRFRIAAVAGTSAGSIVAALVASGYRAQEMVADLAKPREKNFLKDNGLDVWDLVSPPLYRLLLLKLKYGDRVEKSAKALFARNSMPKAGLRRRFVFSRPLKNPFAVAEVG